MKNLTAAAYTETSTTGLVTLGKCSKVHSIRLLNSSGAAAYAQIFDETSATPPGSGDTTSSPPVVAANGAVASEQWGGSGRPIKNGFAYVGVSSVIGTYTNVAANTLVEVTYS